MIYSRQSSFYDVKGSYFLYYFFFFLDISLLQQDMKESIIELSAYKVEWIHISVNQLLCQKMLFNEIIKEMVRS